MGYLKNSVYFICLVALSMVFLCCGLMTTVATVAQYYYQFGQVSAIDDGVVSKGFLSIGNSRLLSLEAGNPIHSSSEQYLLSDGKSNALQLKANNSVTADYQAYGQYPSTSIHFGYNGEYQDPSTALVYLRARDYNPALQRFVVMDSYPLFNRYHFTNQDPINQIDPTGHSSVLLPIIMTGLMVLGGMFGSYHSLSDRFIGEPKAMRLDLPDQLSSPIRPVKGLSLEIPDSPDGGGIIFSRVDSDVASLPVSEADRQNVSALKEDYKYHLGHYNQAVGQLAGRGVTDFFFDWARIYDSMPMGDKVAYMLLISERAGFDINPIKARDALYGLRGIAHSKGARYLSFDSDDMDFYEQQIAEMQRFNDYYYLDVDGKASNLYELLSSTLTVFDMLPAA